MLTGGGSAPAAVRCGSTVHRARASLWLRRRLNNAPTSAAIPLSSSMTDITSTWVFSPAVRDSGLLLLLSPGEGWAEGDAADRLCPAALTLPLIPPSQRRRERCSHPPVYDGASEDGGMSPGRWRWRRNCWISSTISSPCCTSVSVMVWS